MSLDRLTAFLALPLAAALVAGCTPRPTDSPMPASPPPQVVENPGEEVTRPQARPSDEAVAVPAVAPAPGADGYLGETLAGLGAPGEPGRWLSTGLVTRAGAGRVVSASGQELAVELRPSGGPPSAGSHISLAAMQALGLTLGQLATLRVYAD